MILMIQSKIIHKYFFKFTFENFICDSFLEKKKTINQELYLSNIIKKFKISILIYHGANT